MEKIIQLVPGFSYFGKNIGIKDETLDFGGILSDKPCNAAAVFTQNTMPGAPIVVGKEHIQDGTLQAIVVNSKNANVATELRGIEDSKNICQLLGKECGIDPQLVLPSSTGVIGRYLPMDKIISGCKNIMNDFGKTIEHAQSFARSIMTTDTRPKWASAKVGNATIIAFAKGAGMIEPHMATMLSYIVTDAEISAEQLKSMLSIAVNKSFNRISIDTDTSTSDTVVVMANGIAGPVNLELFQKELDEICTFLAKEIVRDGEGATKLIELTITGASTEEQAILTARSVINSPLIKTAIYGADPNWGRFVMAIGKVFKYTVNIKDLKIFFGKGDSRKMIDAQTIDDDRVDLDAISLLLKQNEIFIEIQLGSGKFSDTVWGCDLTEGYVEENAFYTT